ncbi:MULTISPECIES: hypothetical protein [unclassified Cupriavidus]|uniref:hypothetical protein n=1 Tax=unclassified Cupriavidus TaxID=2640874 RepID=UPI00313D7FBB
MRAKLLQQGGVISLFAALLIGSALVGAMGIGPTARSNEIQIALFCSGLALIYLKHPKLSGG